MTTSKDTREVTLVSSDKQEFKLSAEAVKLARMVRTCRLSLVFLKVAFSSMLSTGRFFSQFDPGG
jgi:hypothetical protein